MLGPLDGAGLGWNVARAHAFDAALTLWRDKLFSGLEVARSVGTRPLRSELTT